MTILDEIKVCKICNERVENDNHYWRTHQIKRADFFQSYYPRRDLLTGELIPFKAAESYFLSDFLNKNNLRKYLKSLSLKESKKYCLNYLTSRKEIKQTKYSLSQCELKSLCAPSIIYFDKIFKEEGGYFRVCEQLGYINKYKNYSAFPFFKQEINEIIIDSREQKPLIFKGLENKTSVHKINAGDYKLSNQDQSNVVYFERKALADLIGTLGAGFDRFRREIERAAKENIHLIIMVESSFNDLLSFPYLPQTRFIKSISPDFITHQMRDLMQDYPHIQFLFCDGRPHVVESMIKVFNSGGLYKEIDLQLMLDLKLL